MPGPDYACVAEQLRDAGWPAHTPCAIVSNATSSKQQIRTTKLAKLADEGALPSPALMIIGRVVADEAIEAAEEFWINTALRDSADRDTAI
jgi:siroheme synthase